MPEPTLSTVTVNPDLEKAVQAAMDPASIRAAVLAEAEKQGLKVAEDAAADTARNAQAAADAAAANQGKPFTRVENIGGRDFEFEAASESELDQMVLNAFRVAYAVREDSLTPAAPAAVVDTVAQEAAAAQAATERAAAQVELELKFKRGEVSTAEYLEQSGAVRDYLEKQGTSLEALKEVIESNRDSKTVQSWQEATEQFLKSAVGADWPGGAQNLSIIGLKIAQLGLVEAEDKVAALAQAYNAMKQEKLVFPGETSAATPAVPAAAASAPAATTAPATTTAPAAAAPPAAPAPRTAPQSSSIFGASSGVGGNSSAAPAKQTPLAVPADASPAEIMAAWKDAQLKDGKDPNAAFLDAFAAKRG